MPGKKNPTTLCLLSLRLGLVLKLVASCLHPNKPQPGAGPVSPVWLCRRTQDHPALALQPSRAKCPVQREGSQHQSRRASCSTAVVCNEQDIPAP